MDKKAFVLAKNHADVLDQKTNERIDQTKKVQDGTVKRLKNVEESTHQLTSMNINQEELLSQEMSAGVDVIPKTAANRPLMAEFHGQTLVSMGNSELPPAPYVLADPKTSVKAFREDSWKDGVGKFQTAKVALSTANFFSKVSGSLTENPHVAKYINASALASPNEFSSEAAGTRYNQISTLNAEVFPFSTITNGQIAQQLFSLNIIEQIERKHGFIPADDKVQWVKDNVQDVKANWHGKGSGPSGSEANISWWKTTLNSWVNVLTTTSASISKLSHFSTTYDSGVQNVVDSNGFIHYLAYAEASDGTTASIIETDYVELEVTLKSSANLIQRPIFKRTASFEGKVAGSTVENPHYADSYAGSGLPTPVSDRGTFNADYYRVNELDGNMRVTSNPTNGNYAYQQFSFNVVAEIERKLGGIPANDKLQWLKNNIKKYNLVWFGKGDSPIGNKAFVRVYNNTNETWLDGLKSHSSSSVAEINFGVSGNFDKYTDSNGFVHFLAFSAQSDGTIASVIYTDYVELEIELKPDAELIHPNVPLYQVEQSEYDKILVDWDEAEVQRRYSSVKGMQHVQNPMLTVEGGNLLPPFYEWEDNTNGDGAIVGPYEVLIPDVSATRYYRIYIPALPNQEYNMSSEQDSGGRLYYYLCDGRKTRLNNTINRESVTTTSSTRYFEVIVASFPGGDVIVKKPMLTLGSQPKPFTLYNPSHLYAQAKLGAIGDVKDTLYQDQGQWKVRKAVEKDVVLDGSLSWGLSENKTGFKRFIAPSISRSNIADAARMVKFNGYASFDYSTSSPPQPDMFGVQVAGTLVSVSNADTGFTDGTSPSSSDINRYFNGWKYTDGTTWESVTGNGETATAQEALETKPKDYTPYKLSYVLANSETLDVTDVYGSPMAAHSHISYTHKLGKLGEYENGITEEGTFSSIIKVEKIDRETGKETDVTDSCTLNAEKNGFTSTSLVDGDLVWYELEVENAAGTVDIMYYDSRYVIEDDTNGKVYKYKITASDGVPQISLIEI